MDEEITATEAALLVGISPELLKWFTSYAPKQDGLRKLKVARTEAKMPVFKKSELLEFCQWLAEPWPSKPGTRPHIPDAIVREITKEASGQCAMCHSHGDSCEAAHVEPVAESKNNHPHNLIWLCANHHTKYDKGLLGPRLNDKQFVKDLKGILLGYSKSFYAVQAEAVKAAFHLIEICRRAAALNPQTAEQKALVQKIGEDAIKSVIGVSKQKKPKLDAKSNQAFLKLGQLAASDALEPTKDVKQRLQTIATIREEFRLAAGMAECPLCRGTGHRHGTDCPYCGGDGSVPQRIADSFDARDFEEVDCPLCAGSGRHGWNDCPVCHGDKRMEKRFADKVDIRDFDVVDCPLCEGEGRHGYDICPACHGDKQLERRFADKVDTSGFDSVDCPLCDATGGYDGEDCPVCQGDRRLARRFAENVDLREFETVKCPLCKGRGRYEGYDDCPACMGNRTMQRRFADTVDVDEYAMVECPNCDGNGVMRGDHCVACGGQGQLTKSAAERL